MDQSKPKRKNKKKKEKRGTQRHPTSMDQRALNVGHASQYIEPESSAYLSAGQDFRQA